MKIAIISDTHDHLANLKKVLGAVADADVLLHCGDLVAPFTVKDLGEAFKKPIHIIWGNNDGDQPLIEQNAKSYPQITIHGDEAQLELGGKKIALTHYPARAEEWAESEAHDLIVYGHTHRAEMHQKGKTQVINAGDVMGRFDSKAHFATYDTDTGKVELKSLDVSPA
jgi:putative phosphoesterase